MQICGDPTCDSYGCSTEAIEAWRRQEERNAKKIVDGLLREALAKTSKK